MSNSIPLHQTVRCIQRTSLVACAALFVSSCTDFDYVYTKEQLAYEAQFNKAFGQIDPTNDFNLAQRGEVTVTPNGNRDVSIYKKAANGYQLIARYDDVTSTRTLGFDIPKGETEILVVNGSATKTTTVGGSVTFERGGGSGTLATRAIPVNPGDPADWATRLFKGTDGLLEVRLNNGQDYTYYYYNESEATSFETILPESRLNRDKAVDDFSLISTGEFIIYPTYWNAAVATQVGIYYYDNEGNIHKQPIFGNHIYNESIQYWDGKNWVTPKSEGYNSMNANGKGYDYYPLIHLKAPQYRSKGIIVNLPVGTKFGFYTPMFEDNPTSRKAVGDYKPFKEWETYNTIGINTNVYIPNNINGAVYTKFGGTTPQQWGLTSEFHLNTTTNYAGEKKYAKWWFKDKNGHVIEANWLENQEYLDAHSESHLNPPDVWDKDYTTTTWTDANANDANSPLNYNRHAVMFGMYYDEKGDMVIGAEDCYFLTSTDQSDYDLNDRVFKIYGSQPLVLNNKAQSWHLAFEDLGGSYDWDFNDVVLQIDYVSGQSKARITPIAAGGTLHSQVYFNDTDVDSKKQSLGEIHEWLGATPVADDVLYEPINADSRGVPGVRKEVNITSPKTFSIANAMDKANSAGNGSSKNILGLYIETSGNSTNTIAYQGMGKAPAMLVLPTSYESGDKYLEWAWPTENFDIRKAYNTTDHKFSDWVANHSDAQDWYMYPTEGTVEAKVAGKYANGSTTAGSEYGNDYGTILTQLHKNDANQYVFDANSTLGDATSVTITFALKGKLANNALYAYDGNNTKDSALGSWFRLNNGGTFVTMGENKNTGATIVDVEGMYQITLSEAELTAIKNAGYWAITASADSEIIYIAYKKN